ncbi:MAG: hypothetical protein JNK77_18590 [Saprospiraceae bacterium]|nr:hypothetical protein [Saprospiraceae bacterium]
MCTYWKYIMAVLLIVAVITLYVKEFYWFNRTLNVGRLVLWSMTMGAACGVVAWLFLRRRAADAIDSFRILAFCVLIPALLMPLAASLSNRLLSPHPTVSTPVIFESEKPFYSSRFGFFKEDKGKPSGYYLFFYYQDRLYRVESHSAQFGGIQRGEVVLLPMQRGFWGTVWVRA